MSKTMIICFVSTIRCRFYDGNIVTHDSAESDRRVFFPFRALCAPGWLRKWHVAVRVTKSRKMVGFISAVPIKMKVYDK